MEINNTTFCRGRIPLNNVFAAQFFHRLVKSHAVFDCYVSETDFTQATWIFGKKVMDCSNDCRSAEVCRKPVNARTYSWKRQGFAFQTFGLFQGIRDGIVQ